MFPSLADIRERERAAAAQYRGLAAAWHVVRIDYGVAFILFFLAVVLCLGFLSANLGGRYPSDDGYIGVTLARNLLQTGRFSFDGTTRTVGAASPPMVLLTALSLFLTGRVEVGPVLLGVCLLAACAITAFYWIRAATGSRRTGALAGLLIVSSGWLVFDALSATESLLFVLLILLALLLFEKGSIWFGLPLSLAVWTRSDAWHFAAALAVWVLVNWVRQRDSLRLRQLAHGIGLFFLALIPLLLFNRLMSGAFLPGAAIARSIFFGDLSIPLTARLGKMLSGLDFFAVRALIPLALLLPLGLFLSRAFWQRWYIAVAAALLYLNYGVLFPTGLLVSWHQAQHVLLPFAMLALADGGLELIRMVPPGPRRRALAWGLGLALALVQLGGVARARGQYAGAVRSVRNVEQEVGGYLRRNSGPDDLIASPNIGLIGYSSGRRMFDLSGVTDSAVARCYAASGTGVLPLRQRDVLRLLLERRPLFLVIQNDHKRLLNFDPDRLTDEFHFIGESRPVYPVFSSYRIYRLRRTATPSFTG